MLKLGFVGCLSSVRVSFRPEAAWKVNETVASEAAGVPCSFWTLYWKVYVHPPALVQDELAVAWNDPSGFNFSVKPAVTFCKVFKSTLRGRPLGSTSFSRTPGELIERNFALVAV